jgi:hypothetical protein
MGSGPGNLLSHWVQPLTGKEVPLAEVGLPTGSETGTGAPPGLIRRDAEGARFYERALDKVWRGGAIGAAAWCLDDFPETTPGPPHERLYGLFRTEGTQKPAAESFSRFARSRPERVEGPAPEPIDEEAFYRDAD